MNTIVRRRGPLLISAGLLLGVPLMSACPKVCSDDGFAWQQDPSCLAQLSITDGSTDTDTATATDPTEPTGGATFAGDSTWCVDADKDGFGDPQSCTQVPPGDAPPPGTVDNDDDCDDGDAFTFPGAAPNDDAQACMKDADGDDWGDPNPPSGGGGGGGGAVPGTDCNDEDAFTFPGAAPNDDPAACMKDADDDDWGDPNPSGGSGVVPGTDCDDANMNAWASCDGCKDEDDDGWLTNCDSYPADHPGPDCDDADANTFPGAAPNDDADACMTDADGDDWGDDSPSAPGAVPGSDCDDQSANTFPGAASADDPVACMQDEDGDGHGEARPGQPGVTPGSDCYDTNPDLNPANTVLVTAPLTSGEISQVDLTDGSVDPYAMVDVAGINPWIPTSLAVNPVDGSVFVSLAFNDRLATMDYCGAGKPTLLAVPHKKNICGIAFDRAGQLYGIDGQVDQLLLFNADGSLGQTKPLTFEGKTLNVADCGMAFDCHQDRLLISDSGTGGIYVVDPADGTTTQLADLPSESFGAGLEYDPKTRLALSCDQTAFLSIALDGSSDFTKLPDLTKPADDLTYGPKCQ